MDVQLQRLYHSPRPRLTRSKQNSFMTSNPDHEKSRELAQTAFMWLTEVVDPLLRHHFPDKEFLEEDKDHLVAWARIYFNIYLLSAGYIPCDEVQKYVFVAYILSLKYHTDMYCFDRIMSVGQDNVFNKATSMYELIEAEKHVFRALGFYIPRGMTETYALFGDIYKSLD